MSIRELLFGTEEEKQMDMEKEKEKQAAEGFVNREMLVGEIVMKYPAAADFLMSCGMGCIFCPSAQMESLEQAAMVHGLDAGDICDALNETLARAAAADKEKNA